MQQNVLTLKLLKDLYAGSLTVLAQQAEFMFINKIFLMTDKVAFQSEEILQTTFKRVGVFLFKILNCELFA